MIVLVLASITANAATTQTRVDELVHRCRAEHFVRLVAHDSTEVVIDMKVYDRAPSRSENQKFECVVRGMKRMRDLKFGFIGNEASDR